MEKTETKSPFAALTWQEQQDRWLAWRSRQLDYRPAEKETPAEKPRAKPVAENRSEAQRYEAEGRPRLRLPNMMIAATTRHQELDEVINRHRKALKQAAAFQSTPIG